MRSTTRAIRIAGPSISKPSNGSPGWRRAAGVEGQSFEVLAPLLRMTKADIIRRGTALGLDYGLTHSCYDPDANGRPCGRCDSCQLRARGFQRSRHRRSRSRRQGHRLSSSSDELTNHGSRITDNGTHDRAPLLHRSLYSRVRGRSRRRRTARGRTTGGDPQQNGLLSDVGWPALRYRNAGRAPRRRRRRP